MPPLPPHTHKALANGALPNLFIINTGQVVDLMIREITAVSDR